MYTVSKIQPVRRGNHVQRASHSRAQRSLVYNKMKSSCIVQRWWWEAQRWQVSPQILQQEERMIFIHLAKPAQLQQSGSTGLYASLPLRSSRRGSSTEGSRHPRSLKGTVAGYVRIVLGVNHARRAALKVPKAVLPKLVAVKHRLLRSGK